MFLIGADQDLRVFQGTLYDNGYEDRCSEAGTGKS